MRTSLFFLIAILFSQVLCATYYISQATGSDESGDGLETNPFQSFGKAFNSTDGTAALELYVFPGTYSGENNTGITYAGPLTINYYPNSTEEGASTSVQIDCTSAQGATCLASGTSITIAGLNDASLPQIIFNDCGVCISVNVTDGKSPNNLIDVSGVTFDEVTQYAVFGSNIYQASIRNSSFTDNDAAGLTLVSLFNVDDEILIENNYFSSTNQNALYLFNVSTTTVQRNTFENAFIVARAATPTSQVLIEDNTFTSNANIVAATYVVTLTSGTFTVENSKFNTIGISALKSSSSPTTSIINSTFSMGDGVNGGAAYFENVNIVTISEDCIFSQNIASGFGGAIYLANSTLHLTQTNFTQNVAIDGAAIACAGNETVNYDNTTVFFAGNTNTGGGAYTSDIEESCFAVIAPFQSSYVVSTVENHSDAWIWILVSIAIVFILLVLITGAIFIIYQRKRQSYTRME